MFRGFAALAVAVGCAGCSSVPDAPPARQARASVDARTAGDGPSAAFIGGSAPAPLAPIEWRGPMAEYECPRTHERWTLAATAPLRCRSCPPAASCAPTLLGLLPPESSPESASPTVPVSESGGAGATAPSVPARN